MGLFKTLHGVIISCAEILHEQAVKCGPEEGGVSPINAGYYSQSVNIMSLVCESPLVTKL